MPSPVKLVVGLGNPGPEHAETRHNAGFWYADQVARAFSVTFRTESKFHSDICRIQDEGLDFWICKPLTFMNRSGQAVQVVSAFYKIAIEEILVVHDEIDLDAGVIRLKQGGGHGGNNGIRDIMEQLGGNTFLRLRIGVSHPGNKEAVTPHVLGRPSAEDRELIYNSIEQGRAILPLLLKGNLQQAMQQLHSEEPGKDK